MKGRLLVLGALAGREAAALIEDGQLEELLLAPDAPAPETVLRARVGRPVKGLGGVFLDLPEGRSGYLRAPKGLRPGQWLAVQVTGVAEPGKAVPVTERLLFRGRLAILTPGAPGINVARGLRDPDERVRLERIAAASLAGAPEDLGAILRSAAEGAEEAALRSEIAALRAQAEAVAADRGDRPAVLLPAPSPQVVARRDWPAPDTRADGPDAMAVHGVEATAAALLRPEVALENGAHMTVEPTRALVAVDVNTGADTSPAAALKASLAAARALPRQLRLRGLGGVVVVDFAPFPKRDRGTLEQALRAAFRREGDGVVLAGWTPLGQFELQRRRDRAPLAALLGAGA
jgi:Ribonuclease G/E